MTSRTQKKKDRKRVSAKRRREEHQSGFTGTSIKLPEDTTLFKIEKAGVRRFDVVPYEVGEKAGNPHADAGDMYFERTIYIHWIGADSKPYLCPLKTAKKPCPVCEERGKLAQNPDTDKKTITPLLTKQRQLWNVFDRESPEEGVQLWDYSYHNFGKQLDAKLNHADEEDGYDYFADPKDGFTLRVGFSKESGGGRTWYQATDIEFKNRKESLASDILEAAHDLDSLLILEDYETIQKVFFEMGDDDDDDDSGEEKEKPAKDKKRRPKKEKKKETMTAEEVGLEVGDEATHKEHEEWGTCDITKISSDGTSITIEDEDGEEHRAIGAEDLVKIEDDPEPEPEPESVKTKGKGKKGKGKSREEKKPDPIDDDVDDQDIDESEKDWDDDDDDWDDDN